MVDLQAYLEMKLRDIISAWNEADIYAVSFFVYSNEEYEYKGHSNWNIRGILWKQPKKPIQMEKPICFLQR